MAEFLLDADTASRLLLADRQTVTQMRRSGAKAIAISTVTLAELLYGAPAIPPFRFPGIWRASARKISGIFTSIRCALQLRVDGLHVVSWR